MNATPTSHADPDSVAEADGRPVTIASVRPSHWLLVLCLLGVDYFSTLAYQPSITFQTAGLLGPVATLVVILVTLAGALPVYLYIARRSPHGQGSIALIEYLVHGWVGKTLILILLGFAATDFVMLKTISLADAAEHVTRNALLARDGHLRSLAEDGREAAREALGASFVNYFNEQLLVTILLGVIGFLFWFLLRKGFNRYAVAISVPIVMAYLALNAVVIGAGVWYLADNPGRLADWAERLGSGDWQAPVAPLEGAGWAGVALFAVVLLPHLALGLSGFELSMIVMPQVRGTPGEDERIARGRARNTRKLLVVAALLMSVYLLGGVLVTTLLIPPAQLGTGAAASNRALSYLASGGALAPGDGPASLGPVFGPEFGALYDLSTVIILCLAGTSVMAALGVLLPRFLLRFGMELRWADRWGVLFVWFALLNLAVTVWFRASVEAQRGAYATGVLALIFCASVVTVLDRKRARTRRGGVFFAAVAVIFGLTLAAVVEAYPAGLVIAACFIGTILATSVVSRALRTDELRTVGFEFRNDQSRFLWDSLRLADFPVLVPHRPGRHERKKKEESIRADHQLAADAEIVFIEVEVDDPSNFYQRLLIEVFREDHTFVIKVTRCVSVAHAVASIALEMSRHSRPPGLHFGWSELDLLAASWSYLAFGEGNVPWKVRELILEAEPDPARQPRVIIG